MVRSASPYPFCERAPEGISVVSSASRSCVGIRAEGETGATMCGAGGAFGVSVHAGYRIVVRRS